MKTILIAFALTLTALSKSVADSDIRNQEQILLGTWHEEDSESGLHMAGEKTFRPNGTAEGWIKIWRRSSDGKEVLVGDATFKSRWRIEGNELVSFEVFTEPKGLLDPNKEIRDVILSLDREVFRFKTDDGKTGVYKRKS